MAGKITLHAWYCPVTGYRLDLELARGDEPLVDAQTLAIEDLLGVLKTEDGEPVRDDDHFAHVAVYEYHGPDEEPTRHTEQLEFNELHPKARSYR